MYMRYRPLGRTGQFVSEICLGTMTFSGGAGFWRAIGSLDQASSTGLVGRAIEAGVNFFDTANVYSEGQSEIQLGQALRDLKVKREDVIIATKVRGRMGPGPNAVGLSRGHIMDEIAASLKRLGLDHVDLYQIHGFDPVTPLEETMRALDDCVRRGLVRTIGCSNLAAWQIMKALAISDKNGLARFETVQAYYSIAGRELEREILPLVEDQGLGMMVWSPLAGGFLSGKFTRSQSGGNDTRRTIFDFPPVDKERAFDIIDAMAPIAKAHDASVARVALAWLLQRKGVMSVIMGAKTIQQLDDNIAAADLALSGEEIATLDAVSALKPEYPGWMLARQADGRVPAPKAEGPRDGSKGRATVCARSSGAYWASPRSPSKK
jgi:aryl-alcohol dehydrogenase-like predicted oxidoreductase